jgi:hypothetical protein
MKRLFSVNSYFIRSDKESSWFCFEDEGSATISDGYAIRIDRDLTGGSGFILDE